MFFKWWLIIVHVMVGIFSPSFSKKVSFVSDISLLVFLVVENVMAVLTDWSLAFLSVNILCPIKKDNIEQTFCFRTGGFCNAWLNAFADSVTGIKSLNWLLLKLFQCTSSWNITFSPTLHLKMNETGNTLWLHIAETT